jgi:hypothetical protein
MVSVGNACSGEKSWDTDNVGPMCYAGDFHKPVSHESGNKILSRLTLKKRKGNAVKNRRRKNKVPEPSGASGRKAGSALHYPNPAYSVHFRPEKPERTERRTLFFFSLFGKGTPAPACLGWFRDFGVMKLI